MMTMSLLLLALSPAASAAEPAAFEPLPTLDRWVLSEGVAANKTANNKKGGKKTGGGKNNGGIDVPPGPQIPGWRTEYYIQPGAGVRLYQNGAGETKTLATFGGEAGLSYRQKGKDLPKMVGRTRLSGEVMATGDLDKGLDVRAGSFIGPQWKNLGVQAGPDLFYNQWTFGSQVLDPSIGVEIPVTATLSGEKLTAFAGVSPAYLMNEDRRVDWDKETLPGFGHEFTYMGGLTGRFNGLKLSAQVQYRITAAGPIPSFSVNAGANSEGIQQILEIFGVGGGSSSGGTRR
jgi:hypothetical protein